MANYTLLQRAYIVMTDAEVKIHGPFDTHEAMSADMHIKIKELESIDVVAQICVLEQKTRFTIRKKDPELEIVVEPAVIQPSDIGTPVPQGDVPQPESPEVLAYRAQLEPMSAEDLRQLANLKGIDGRIQNRDRLIEELIMIFKLEQ
jgi:hypothetical protein